MREDAPPVQTARPKPGSAFRKEPAQDKEQKKLRDRARQATTVAHIIGMAEADEEGIIPPDAERIDPFANQIPGLKETPTLSSSSPAEPTITHGEELIPPTAALVAPDVTPNILEPIDPSQVPAPPRPQAPPPPTSVQPGAPPEAGALDTILGRTQPQPATTPAPPVTAESFIASMTAPEPANVAESLVPANEGGAPMPEHKEGDGRTVYNVMRRLGV